jgi:Domain of unknown function (DUF5680)
MVKDTEPSSARALYAFLRKALLQVSSNSPLRGPEVLEDDGYTYRCESAGDLENFSGVETIAIGNETRYELRFAGGAVR